MIIKKDYHVNIYENPVSKFCDHDNCNKTAVYNFWGMKPIYCFDNKDKLHVNIRKNHKLCYKHYISHSRKLECPKCKIKKLIKCDECNTTASYNFPKLRPLKCLKHREPGMVNIKRKHMLCKVHDIFHSKKSGCKKCKLDLDNYDTSSKYMQDKIYNNFHNNLIKNIKRDYPKQPIKQMYANIMNNTTNKKFIKFKLIEDERNRLDNVKSFKYYYDYHLIKSEVNDLYNITINLNNSIRNINNRFENTKYKKINNYIENIINKDTKEYKKIKYKFNTIKLKINEIRQKIKEDEQKKDKENLEKEILEDELNEKEISEKIKKK